MRARRGTALITVWTLSITGCSSQDTPTKGGTGEANNTADAEQENNAAPSADPPTSADNQTAKFQRTSNLRQLFGPIMRLSKRGNGLEDIKDKSGKPILSWRARLLQYVDAPAGAASLRLDEPWDSDHNRKVMAGTMPTLLGNSKEGMTSIMMCTRDGKLLPKYMEARDTGKIMLVKAGADQAVPWTKPQDLPIVDANPASVLGTLPSGTFIALFYGGHISDVDAQMEPARLLAMILPQRMTPAKSDKARQPDEPPRLKVPLRTWKDDKGKSIEARLWSVRGDSVQLAKADGTFVTLSLSSLSQEDQEYAKGVPKK